MLNRFLIIKYFLYTIAIIVVGALVVLIISFFFKDQYHQFFISHGEVLKLISISSGLIFVILLSGKFNDLHFNLRKSVDIKQIQWIILFLLILLPLEYIYIINNSSDHNALLASNFQWISIFRIVLVVPILEELVFRGFFQTGLTKKYEFWVACIVSSIFFTITHVGNFYYMILVFTFSIAAGFIFLKSKSLLFCILFHVLFNLGIVLITFYVR